MNGISRRAFLAAAAATTAGLALAQGAAFAQEAEVEPDFYALGWQPDLPSLEAEQKYELGFNADLPPKVDLSTLPEMPDVYNQGQIGSCVANAVAGAIQFARRRQEKATDFVPSRLYLYYYAREKLGPVSNDKGSRISDAMQVARENGVCEDRFWTYDGTGSTNGLFAPTAKAAQVPAEECRNNAGFYKITLFQSPAKTENNLKGLLASGTPIVFGFSVYSNMYEGKRPTRKDLELPSSSDTLVGGHAVVLVGYDDGTRMFRVRNSWGTTVHDHGYFNMSYDYVLSPLARDFWVIQDTLSIAAPLAAS